MKRIFITGGHITPALAVSSVLHQRGWDMYYLGRIHALEGDSAESVEVGIVRAKGYTFLPIVAGRLQRKFTRFTISSLLKIPVGFLYALWYLLKFRPSAVVAFGGYIALPVVLIAWLLRIPVVLHEQTMRPGLSNKFLARFATTVCVSWKDTVEYFKGSKILVTGNPVRGELIEGKNTLSIPTHKPLLYITGGNLGSHVINETVGKCISVLTQKFVVIHQCGNSSVFNDYKNLSALKNTLRMSQRDDYFLYQYITADHLGWIFDHCDVMVSRSGANTVSEIIQFALPALLIPLPYSGNGEQLAHAKYLEKNNAALLLSQSELHPQSLLEGLKQLQSQKKEIKTQLKRMQKELIKDADQKIADVVESVARW